MKKSVVLLTTVFILVFGIALSYGQNVSEEARRHFDRGMAALDMAKSPAECEPAIKEFEQAARLAPDWPDAFYNLGAAQAKAEKYGDAVRSFQQYLRLAPNADDAADVKSIINKLEYKAEQFISDSEALDIFASLSDPGKWELSGDHPSLGWAFNFRRVGDKIRIKFQTLSPKEEEMETGMAQANGKILKYNAWMWWPYLESKLYHEVVMEIVSRTKVKGNVVTTGYKNGNVDNRDFEYNLK